MVARKLFLEKENEQIISSLSTDIEFPKSHNVILYFVITALLIAVLVVYCCWQYASITTNHRRLLRLQIFMQTPYHLRNEFKGRVALEQLWLAVQSTGVAKIMGVKKTFGVRFCWRQNNVCRQHVVHAPNIFWAPKLCLLPTKLFGAKY